MPAVQHLAHDHADLNTSVVKIGTMIRGTSSGAGLADELRELRERLFLHFAREEEGLFPFVTDVLPKLADRVSSMAVAHDTICGSLARLCHLADRDAPPTAIAELFDRFESSYAEHARTEAELLRELDAQLDTVQRQQLGDLVAGL